MQRAIVLVTVAAMNVPGAGNWRGALHPYY